MQLQCSRHPVIVCIVMVPMIGVADGCGKGTPVMHVHVDLRNAAFSSCRSDVD